MASEVGSNKLEDLFNALERATEKSWGNFQGIDQAEGSILYVNEKTHKVIALDKKGSWGTKFCFVVCKGFTADKGKVAKVVNDLLAQENVPNEKQSKILKLLQGRFSKDTAKHPLVQGCFQDVIARLTPPPPPSSSIPIVPRLVMSVDSAVSSHGHSSRTSTVVSSSSISSSASVSYVDSARSNSRGAVVLPSPFQEQSVPSMNFQSWRDVSQHVLSLDTTEEFIGYLGGLIARVEKLIEVFQHALEDQSRIPSVTKQQLLAAESYLEDLGKISKLIANGDGRNVGWEDRPTIDQREQFQSKVQLAVQNFEYLINPEWTTKTVDVRSQNWRNRFIIYVQQNYSVSDEIAETMCLEVIKRAQQQVSDHRVNGQQQLLDIYNHLNANPDWVLQQIEELAGENGAQVEEAPGRHHRHLHVSREEYFPSPSTAPSAAPSPKSSRSVTAAASASLASTVVSSVSSDSDTSPRLAAKLDAMAANLKEDAELGKAIVALWAYVEAMDPKVKATDAAVNRDVQQKASLISQQLSSKAFVSPESRAKLRQIVEKFEALRHPKAETFKRTFRKSDTRIALEALEVSFRAISV